MSKYVVSIHLPNGQRVEQRIDDLRDYHDIVTYFRGFITGQSKNPIASDYFNRDFPMYMISPEAFQNGTAYFTTDRYDSS